MLRKRIASPRSSIFAEWNHRFGRRATRPPDHEIGLFNNSFSLAANMSFLSIFSFIWSFGRVIYHQPGLCASVSASALCLDTASTDPTIIIILHWQSPNVIINLQRLLKFMKYIFMSYLTFVLVDSERNVIAEQSQPSIDVSAPWSCAFVRSIANILASASNVKPKTLEFSY